jgi:membrane associated rhomboid family serine protease
VIPLKDDVPSRSYPSVTVLLIILNVVVYLMDLSSGGELSRLYAMRPVWITHHLTANVPGTGVPVWATLFTMMFLHGGLMHIGGNMLYLWIFGNNTEDTLGHGRYLVFYFVCGLVAEAIQIAVSWDSSVPTIGASGAIAGVLGAYLFLFPDARITTLVIFFFITVIEIPARIVLGFWFLFNLYSTLVSAAATLYHSQSQGGVAFGAHVGGFAAGWILIQMLAGRRREPPPYIQRPRFIDDNWR